MLLQTVQEMVMDTKHAVGLRTKARGLLIYVSTVQLEGKYFDVHVTEGQKLKAGDACMKRHGADSSQAISHYRLTKQECAVEKPEREALCRMDNSSFLKEKGRQKKANENRYKLCPLKSQRIPEEYDTVEDSP